MYFDILKYYPKSRSRLDARQVITDEHRQIACRFDFDYFDGSRSTGYGGYHYDPRFWTRTSQHLAEHYNLTNESSVLDIGCAKGFLLKDLKKFIPNSRLVGIDISPYAIENADPDVREVISVGDARALPFEDKSFDLVLSINTIHNLNRPDCIIALKEMTRVSRGHACVVVDAWKTSQQREELEKWVLTAKTLMHEDDWIQLFLQAGFDGDYAFWNLDC